MAEEPGSSSLAKTAGTDQSSPSPLGHAKSETTPSGRSFLDAVWDKFHDDMGIDSSIEIYVPKKGPAKITDSGHLILPRRLNLNDCGITSANAGQPADMTSMCFAVTELDLTQNPISSWEEVFNVIHCMPHLIFLNVTHNPLGSSPACRTDDSAEGRRKGEDEKSVLGRLPDLRQLVLNDTRLAWSCIVDLLKLFPNLEELHLSLNDYTSVDLPPDFTYPSLQRLFFNGNKVYCWSEINKLGNAFPNLQQMFLAETNLCTLDETDWMASNFSCLESLSLTKTQLEGWEEFEKLRLLPSLTDVRLLGIPFLEEIEEKERRQLLVARLPNITRLNGSPVTAEEREDAERAFIRAFMDSDEKPERYHELEEVYGRLDPLVHVSLKPQTHFNVTVNTGDRKEKMVINSNQTVRELKKTLQNIAGLPANKFTLFYLDSETAFGPERLHFPDKMLYTYNLSDGDEFIIQPK
ncbi:hypothetical protein BaRGS_00011645 [Batillaria attramentaria]|uniref:Ubiquitin-like domain-containing protein n=1 Tax=Batillaria attramentaria TaxID=370345 RepID=A0ABD0LCK7_9CAEN